MGSGGSRSIPAPGAVLRTRTGISPFGVGFVEAETPGRIGLSSEHPKPYGKIGRPRLAAGRAQQLDRHPRSSTIAPGTATVLFLAGIDPTGERRRALFDDVNARLPGLMSELGDRPPAGGPGGGPDVFGGPGPSAPAPAYDFGAAGSNRRQTVLRPPGPGRPRRRDSAGRRPAARRPAVGCERLDPIPFAAPVPPGPDGPAATGELASQASPAAPPAAGRRAARRPSNPPARATRRPSSNRRPRRRTQPPAARSRGRSTRPSTTTTSELSDTHVMHEPAYSTGRLRPAGLDLREGK